FAVFLWFAAVGWATVAMAGGIRYRVRKPKPVRPTEQPAEPHIEAPVPVDPVPDVVVDDELSVATEPGVDADDPPMHD
ncbi:MAG: hypothetical protein WB777_12620, partial [Mycobacterium sp.]